MHYIWKGKTLTFADRTVELTDVLSDGPLFPLGECVVLVQGKTKGTDEPVVVKLRVE